MLLHPEDHALAEIPKAVIDRSERHYIDHYLLDGYYEVEIPGGIESGLRRVPVYRTETQTSHPYLRCDGFTARVFNSEFYVELASGTTVTRSWKTGEVITRVPCTRGCRYTVRIEDLEAHLKDHCPYCVKFFCARCGMWVEETDDKSCNLHQERHHGEHERRKEGLPPVPRLPERFIRAWHEFNCISRRLGLPEPSPGKSDELRGLVLASRMDLVFRHIITAARKQGRVIAISKLPDVPCARCGIPIKTGDLIEKLPQDAAGLLERRTATWAHVSCTTPNPNPGKPRAAIASYSPLGDERQREAQP